MEDAQSGAVLDVEGSACCCSGSGSLRLSLCFLLSQLRAASADFRIRRLLLMIPQFAGQAAMLVPFALLLPVEVRSAAVAGAAAAVYGYGDAVRSLSGRACCWLSAVLALAALLARSAYCIPDAGSDGRSDYRRRGLPCSRCRLGPSFEEFFFRGLLQPVAARSPGVIGGILMARCRSRCCTVRSMHGRGGTCC